MNKAEDMYSVDYDLKMLTKLRITVDNIQHLEGWMDGQMNILQVLFLLPF